MSERGPVDPPDLFDRARQVALCDIIRTPLFRVGKRMRGPCEICGHSAKKRGDGCFSLDPSANCWWCFSCDRGGDVIAFVAQRDKVSPREAARWLVAADWPGPAPPPPAPLEVSRPAPAPVGSTERIASDLWRQGRAAAGSPVETYLRSRGIEGLVLARALEWLRFHPHAYWGTQDGARVHMPAMVAQPRAWSAAGGDIGAATGGAHVTYLAPDGRGKCARAPAKKAWGPQASAEGLPGAVWLSGPSPMDAGAVLLIGEGIETSLAAAMLVDRPCRVVAALDLRRLQGGVLRDKWGRIDPDCPTGDPEKPPWTWPGVDEVIVAIDRDMTPGKVKVRKAWGGSAERILSGDDRARLCAALASAAWRRAGAGKVTTIAPAAGRDFDDELLSRGA